MAIVTLLQGCCYLGLSIWGMTLEKCSQEVRNIETKPFEFVLDNLYFADEKCGNPVVEIRQIDKKYTLDVNWAKSFKITHRLNILLITYVVVSTLWIITSLMVLTTLCGALTKVVSALCYWPWFLAIMAGCVLDAVATGYFVSDIYHTMSTNDYFAYTGITVQDKTIFNYLSTYDAYFVTPAVVMTCISSRVVLIWFLNIFGTIFCLSLSNVLANQADNSTNNAGKEQRRLEQQQEHQQVQQALQSLYPEDRQIPPQPQIEPKPLPIQQNSYEADNRRSGDFGPSAPPSNRTENNSRLIIQAKGVTTYRNTDTHPDRLDYPVQPTTAEIRNATESEISPTSPLNQRYSTPDGPQYPNPQQRVSYELRSQLPWSYTNSMSKPGQSPEDLYPTLPVPDYTLHQQR